MDSEIDDDPVNWKAFHNTTREYVIFLLLFVSLYVISYFFICLFRKRVNCYADCYEDAFANRISLWLSSFSLSVSIGAALLLPISIISNEVLLLYPNSYYVQWLNSSLIQGLWNLVFLFSNVSLFLFLPFSHFIMDSEGLPGSPKGIMARVNEAVLVLGLIGLVIMGIIYLISAMFESGPYIQPTFSIPSYYLPFLYSCVSFLGVLMLLLCTPVGVARLFSVISDLLTKPKITLHAIEFHSIVHDVLLCKLKSGILVVRFQFWLSFHFFHYMFGAWWRTHLTVRKLTSSFKEFKIQLQEAPIMDSITEDQALSIVEKANCHDDPSNFFLNSELHHRRVGTVEYRDLLDQSEIEVDNFNHLNYFYNTALEEKPKFTIPALRRNCLYPFVMLFILLLTIVSILMVCQNALELFFGIKSLPILTNPSQNLSLGISSLSTLGPIGAAGESIMILYLWCTSVVGLYSLPLFCLLKPKLHNTSLSQIIGNCTVLLVLSSALPVLARSLGITNFDLLGDFGKINWLGNFYVVLFHNIVFAVTGAFCLVTKITGSIRKEIYDILCSMPPFMWIIVALRPSL